MLLARIGGRLAAQLDVDHRLPRLEDAAEYRLNHRGHSRQHVAQGAPQVLLDGQAVDRRERFVDALEHELAVVEGEADWR